MNCQHESPEEIAHPSIEVHNGRVIEVRMWFCRGCGSKWETREDLGEAECILMRVEMK